MGIGEQVEQRAATLLADTEQPPDIDDKFIKECLDANERGDGVLYASINRGKYIYNTTPKDGEWLRWGGHVWERDEFRHSMGAVEHVALEYEQQAINLEASFDGQRPKKGEAKPWQIALADKYRSRVDRLRTVSGAAKVLTWAPVVDLSMACRESDFDRNPWILPCANGVIELKTGALRPGRPDDMMSRSIPIAYDPTADTSEWLNFIHEVSGSPAVGNFLQRLFGYAITGCSHEQYIAVFIGSGRNGKGVLFSCIASVIGPYYHVINPSMLTEQKMEPSPNAASEHKYAMMGKRVVVAGETKRGQNIDAGQVKALTGDDDIECRPLFRNTVVFSPTHTLFLHTNHMPTGIGSEFSLIQRLLKIDFPYSYVDYPAAEERKYPSMAGRFKPKDRTLKDRLMANKPAILKWLVDGCLLWQEHGLKPPADILQSVDELARAEDYLGEYMTDCIIAAPDDFTASIKFPKLYSNFLWWWENNKGDRKKAPANRTIAKAMRERGHVLDKKGGIMVVHGVRFNPEIASSFAQE